MSGEIRHGGACKHRYFLDSSEPCLQVVEWVKNQLQDRWHSQNSRNPNNGIVNLRALAIDCDQNGSGMWTYRGETRITRGQMPR
jgi:hypothetical protein